MNAKNQLEEMSLIDHLTELRKRLLWSFIYIIIIFCVCFYFASNLFYFLAKPLVCGSHVAIGVREAEEGWMEHLAGFALDA